ncbi:MAG: hypothetical protein QM727_14860 [Niabella sp.]
MRHVYIPLFYFLALSHGREMPPKQTVLEGSVLTETGNPVKLVHVYVVKGEEEALTDRNGFFRITTTQDYPLELTAFHPDYKLSKVYLKDLDKKRAIIRLKAK